MNRTIKEATVKRCHYETHDQLQKHLNNFVDACNFSRHLKSLKGARLPNSSVQRPHAQWIHL